VVWAVLARAGILGLKAVPTILRTAVKSVVPFIRTTKGKVLLAISPEISGGVVEPIAERFNVGSKVHTIPTDIYGHNVPYVGGSSFTTAQVVSNTASIGGMEWTAVKTLGKAYLFDRSKPPVYDPSKPLETNFMSFATFQDLAGTNVNPALQSTARDLTITEKYRKAKEPIQNFIANPKDVALDKALQGKIKAEDAARDLAQKLGNFAAFDRRSSIRNRLSGELKELRSSASSRLVPIKALSPFSKSVVDVKTQFERADELEKAQKSGRKFTLATPYLKRLFNLPGYYIEWNLAAQAGNIKRELFEKFSSFERIVRGLFK